MNTGLLTDAENGHPPQHGVGVDGHDVEAAQRILGGLVQRGGLEDLAATLGRHADAHAYALIKRKKFLGQESDCLNDKSLEARGI